MRAPGAGLSTRLPATLQLARVRAQTTLDVLRVRRRCLRDARDCGMHPRRWHWTPATLQRLRAVGDARRRAQAGVRLEYSVRGTRSQPPLSAQGYQLGVRHVRLVSGRRALL